MQNVQDLPLVSICIPTFNGEKYISSSLFSALSQTYQNIEIIISDDNSKDRTIEIINSYKNWSSVDILIFQHPQYGLVQNWNFCLHQANGKYIKFLHQDDILEPECVEKMVDLAEQDEEIGLVFSPRGILMSEDADREFVCLDNYKNGQNLHAGWNNLQAIQSGRQLLSQPDLLEGHINKIGEPTTVLIRKDVFENVGYFDPDLPQLVDVEMWLRILSQYKVGFVDRMLSHWRLHPEQQSCKNFKNPQTPFTLDLIKLYNKILKNQKYPQVLREKAQQKYSQINQNLDRTAIFERNMPSNLEAQTLTIFTTTKPFQGHSGMIQRNAIQSWLSLHPKPEVILLGKEEGVEEISRELGLRYISDIDRNEYGTPTISGLFNTAQTLSSNNILIYTNADIIFLSDLIPAIEKVSTQFKDFLIVGQRRNFDIPGLINFTNPNWESGLKKLVLEKEDLHPDCAIDYFIFTKNLWSEIPPFAVGRAAWDIAMVYRALAAGHPVIDATSAIVAVHQNHNYGHLSGGQTQAWKGVEAQRNHVLAGGAFPKGMGYGGIGYISDATWKLTPTGLIQNTPRIAVTPTQPKQPEAGFQSTPAPVTSETPEQTIAACYESLKTQPNSPETYKTLGNALQAQGKSKEAIRAYIKAIEIDPNFAEAHANLGNMAYLQGQLDEAMTCYQKALQLNPKLAGVYANMSRVLQQQGRSYEAEFYQGKALELSSNSG
ncbi:MAG TPA: glycosyltransferase [Oscillatoriales cyanobacterium M59_W2019_021]|nr:glycosyltransferase [Oscillatoriales cyanobacterium M4454_W2019_049]HIK51665.1 glycosyltransferase [Oscillatoriales cyanobacterium M59_W2019_021]